MVASDDTTPLTKRQRRTFLAILSFTAAISIQSLGRKPWEYYDNAAFREDQALVQEMEESAESDNLLNSMNMNNFDASVLAIPDKGELLHRHLAEVLPDQRFLAPNTDNTQNGNAGTGDYNGNGPCCGLCNAHEKAGCRKFD